MTDAKTVRMTDKTTGSTVVVDAELAKTLPAQQYEAEKATATRSSTTTKK